MVARNVLKRARRGRQVSLVAHAQNVQNQGLGNQNQSVVFGSRPVGLVQANHATSPKLGAELVGGTDVQVDAFVIQPVTSKVLYRICEGLDP